MTEPPPDAATRARLSLGISATAIHSMVRTALERQQIAGGTLLDVGCGEGGLHRTVGDLFDHYIGADIVRYPSFPSGARFLAVDLTADPVALPDATADVVAAVETIEHLENPRAFMRALVRAARPGGWVVITTPNQLSLLSKLTLVVKGQFNAFQDGSYPAHLTALVETDLLRIAREAGLESASIDYSRQARIPLTPVHYPRALSSLLPRALSDNILLIARKPPS